MGGRRVADQPDRTGAGRLPGLAGKRRGLTSTIAGAAGLIAVLTVLARIVGFGRVFVFSGTVGFNRVGDIYQTVNTIPNVVFEIVAGGALASVVVPLLSAAVTRRDHAEVNRVASALLTWTVTVLTPLAVLVAVSAGPLVRLMLGADATPADLDFGRLLLVIFAPQLVLYGVGLVLAGTLQAHHRFAGPALAPLLSSLTVIGAYLVYAAVGGAPNPAGLSRTAELVLAVGTTLGVVVLSLSLLVPLSRTTVRLQPTYRFPAGVPVRVRRLVGSGVAAVVGQQAALVVVLLLAQPPAPEGSVVAYTVAMTVFLLPWGVLAVPLATAVFPRLASAFDRGDRAGYDRSLRVATHSVILVTAAAAAALLAAARPIGTIVTAVGNGAGSTAAVTGAIAAFAPGLPGYGLLALLTRALYAAGAARSAAVVTLGGWAVVIIADIALAASLPENERVPALAAGHTIGMTLLGVALLALAAHRVGRTALVGVPRVAVCSVVAGAVAALVGSSVAGLLPGDGVPAVVGQGLLAGVVVLAVFAAVVAALDRRQLRPLVRELAARVARRSGSEQEPADGGPKVAPREDTRQQPTDEEA